MSFLTGDDTLELKHKSGYKVLDEKIVNANKKGVNELIDYLLNKYGERRKRKKDRDLDWE